VKDGRDEGGMEGRSGAGGGDRVEAEGEHGGYDAGREAERATAETMVFPVAHVVVGRSSIGWRKTDVLFDH
jgi:hypothetical protein